MKAALRFTAAAMFGVCLCSVQVNACVITYSTGEVDLYSSDPETTYDNYFDKFDSSLGSLNSVTLTFEGFYSVDIEIQNLSAAQNTIAWSVNSSLVADLATDTGNANMQHTFADSGIVTLDAYDGFPLGPDYTSFNKQIGWYTTPTEMDLDPYQNYPNLANIGSFIYSGSGSSTINIPVTRTDGTLGLQSQDGKSQSGAMDPTYQYIMTITYDYTGLPETTPYIEFIAMAAILLFGGLQARKMRKTA